jgi:hypothetical protein
MTCGRRSCHLRVMLISPASTGFRLIDGGITGEYRLPPPNMSYENPYQTHISGERGEFISQFLLPSLFLCSAMHPIWASAAAGVVRNLYQPFSESPNTGLYQLVHTVVHQHEPRSLRGFATLLFLLPVAISLASRPESLLGFVATFSRALPVYWASLAVSVGAYRLSPFHPLARHPGPLLARVSRLWALRVVLSGKQHLVSHQLFERYGDVVRTGPNHLIVRDAAAIPTVLGGRDMWFKGGRKSRLVTSVVRGGAYLAEGYDAGKPAGTTGSLLSQMTPVGHAERRKIWDRAFTASALKSYEPLLGARVSELAQQLSAHLGTNIDIAEWLRCVPYFRAVLCTLRADTCTVCSRWILWVTLRTAVSSTLCARARTRLAPVKRMRRPWP